MTLVTPTTPGEAGERWQLSQLAEQLGGGGSQLWAGGTPSARRRRQPPGRRGHPAEQRRQRQLPAGHMFRLPATEQLAGQLTIETSGFAIVSRILSQAVAEAQFCKLSQTRVPACIHKSPGEFFQSDFWLLKCGPTQAGPHFKRQKSDWTFKMWTKVHPHFKSRSATK